MPIYTDKKTNRLYIEFQYKGTRVKERLHAGATKADAERLQVKLKNDLMFQTHGVTDRRDISFEKFLAEYFGPYAESHYSTDTFDKAVYICKAALPFFKGKAMRSIKAADIERFKASRIGLQTRHKTPRKPATVEREMSVISRAFSIAVRNDLIDYNPCSRVERLKFDNVQDKILRREDEAAFFNAMHSEWAKDICRMVLNTGLRQNDIMTLTKQSVDRTEAVLRLVQGKTKRRVIIPLNATALEIIDRRWWNGRKLLFPSPVSGTEKGSVRHAIQRACVRAEIPVLTIRDLRRTFGTRVVEDGADAVTAAGLLGHTGLRMIPRYVRSLELMRKASDSLTRPVVKLKVVKK